MSAQQADADRSMLRLFGIVEGARYPIAAIAVVVTVMSVGFGACSSEEPADRARSGGSVSTTIASGGATSPTVPELPVIGGPAFGDSRFDDVRLPVVDVSDLGSFFGETQGEMGPSFGFTPPQGWEFGKALTEGSSADVRDSDIFGYAVDDAANPSRFVLAFQSNSSVLPEGKADTVKAADGTSWAIREWETPNHPDLPNGDAGAIVAFEQPVDGQGAILFVGIAREVWVEKLSSMPTANVVSVTPDAGVGGAGVAVAGLEVDGLSWTQVTTGATRSFTFGDFGLLSPSVRATSGVPPEALEVEAQIASYAAQTGRERGAPPEVWKCQAQGALVVCGKISDPVMGMTPYWAKLSVWTAGRSVAVRFGIYPDGWQKVFDQLGAMFDGLTERE